MNRERILALADLIEKQPHTGLEDEAGFNMEYLVHDCGTPSCIAGWAAWEQMGRPEKVFTHPKPIENVAAEWLGISPSHDSRGCSLHNSSYALFYPGEQVNSHYTDITPTQAAMTLRHLAKTGEVDWKIGGVE